MNPAKTTPSRPPGAPRSSAFALPLTLGVVGLVGVFGAHTAQRYADELRYERRLDDLNAFQPNGESMRVASLGFHTALADLVWFRTVLQFGDLLEAADPATLPWLKSSVQAVITLDPRWRTPYFYGGGFLRVFGDLDGSDEVYARGRVAFPDDPFFPFSLGMNAFLYRGDRGAAAVWLERAAALPGAPDWYHAAAAGFMNEDGERRAAIRYLAEQLKTETRPGVQAALRKKTIELMHDERVDEIEVVHARFRAARGRPVSRPDELGPLPEDPYGKGWVLGADGRIRSAEAEEAERRRGVGKERAMLLLSLPVASP